MASKQSRIEFGGEQRVLEALHHPVEDRDDHFDVHVLAQFAAVQAEADKTYGAVGIFADEEAVDLALQDEIGAIVSQERNTIGDPVLVHEMFGADQPVAENFEEASLANFGGASRYLAKERTERL